MKKTIASFLIAINLFASSDLIHIHIPHVLNEYHEYQEENNISSFFYLLQSHHENCRNNSTNNLGMHHYATSHKVISYTLNQIKMLPQLGFYLKGNQSLESITYIRNYFSFFPLFHADGVFRPPISIA